MRGAAMSVWIFINLLCFGMCGYLYLIWSQYWMYIEKQRLYNKPVTKPERSGGSDELGYRDTYSSEKYVQNYYTSPNISTVSVKLRKNRRSAVRALWSSKLDQQTSKSSILQSRRATNVVIKSYGSPRFPNTHKQILEFDSDKYSCYDLNEPGCDAKTSEFKESLLKEFNRVLMSDSNVFESGVDSKNPYNVQYKGVGAKREMSGKEVLCALRRVPLSTVTARDQPFASRGFRIPTKPPLSSRVYNTCAVVTSAGAMIGSRLGEFIDSHDMVLRFNNAPTTNYTEDVGSKTMVRVLNSQVVTKREFNFLEDPLYRSVSLLLWDPANYSSTLEDWFQHPDFPLFPVYKRLLEKRPGVDAHLLRPAALWALWSVLQDVAPYRLRRHPPSSGFIGLWFALHHCGRVRAFEYVPSTRVTRRCHYHSLNTDPACTLGSWHPLAQEKAVAEKIRDNPDKEVFQIGYIDVPGFRTISC